MLSYEKSVRFIFSNNCVRERETDFSVTKLIVRSHVLLLFEHVTSLLIDCMSICDQNFNIIDFLQACSHISSYLCSTINDNVRRKSATSSRDRTRVGAARRTVETADAASTAHTSLDSVCTIGKYVCIINRKITSFDTFVLFFDKISE